MNRAPHRAPRPDTFLGLFTILSRPPFVFSATFLFHFLALAPSPLPNPLLQPHTRLFHSSRSLSHCHIHRRENFQLSLISELRNFETSLCFATLQTLVESKWNLEHFEISLRLQTLDCLKTKTNNPVLTKRNFKIPLANFSKFFREQSVFA